MWLPAWIFKNFTPICKTTTTKKRHTQKQNDHNILKTVQCSRGIHSHSEKHFQKVPWTLMKNPVNKAKCVTQSIFLHFLQIDNWQLASLQYQKHKHVELLCDVSKEWLNYDIVGQRLNFPFSTEKQCSLPDNVESIIWLQHLSIWIKNNYLSNVAKFNNMFRNFHIIVCR